jgi:hypothetical protein
MFNTEGEGERSIVSGEVHVLGFDGATALHVVLQTPKRP